MSHSELLVALENVIIDKVVTVPTARNRKIDTSAPMELVMAAKDDVGSLRDQRIVDLALQGCLRRNRWRKMRFRKGSELERKNDTNVAKMGGINRW